MKPWLLFVLTLSFAGCSGEALAPQIALVPPAIQVVTASVTKQPVMEVLGGTVRADRSVVLMARVGGTVQRIEAVPGQSVATGAVLVTLAAPELVARRDQAAAVAAQGVADLERVRQLIAVRAVTPAEFDAVSARAAASSAAALDADIQVGYTRIGVPFPGVIVRRLVELGDQVGPGRPLVEIVDPATLRLEVSVPESLMVAAGPGVRLGERLRVQINDHEELAPIVEIAPVAEVQSHAVLVKLAIAGTGIRPGAFGRVYLPRPGATILTTPASAVVQRGQLEGVFLVVDERVRWRLIRRGDAAEGRIGIRAGLIIGDVVAVDPAGLRDGQAVTVRP